MLHDVNNIKPICMNSNYSINKHELDGQVAEKLTTLHDMPKQLFYVGRDPNILLVKPTVAVVGARKMTAYGKAVTEQLAAQLAAAGIVVVSGLALGVDAAAQRSTLQTPTPTIAVLAGGLDAIHPPSHRGLANDILRNGGTLISEYIAGTPSLPHQFIARNRIIAALADAVVITEASLRSGSIHTANFALDIGKPVLAVPGPITSTTSQGTNQLIKTGAQLITDINDIYDALGITKKAQQLQLTGKTDAESAILLALSRGIIEGKDLLAASKLTPASFQHTLTMLEINGSIKPLGADKWAIV